MFNPHIHQQQQQQFHQHLRQLQQLFQQQPPPPPPPQPPPGHHVPHHHHQTARAMPVPPQTATPPRMVNLCQASQTTIIAPNPMLQGALLMQQMQGNMRNFGMGGQQFHQFFTAGTRSSLLGPVPMGMAIKSHIMGFPAARPFHPHTRFYNNNNNNNNGASTAPSSSSTITDAASRQPDRKRDSEQMASGSAGDQPTAISADEACDKAETDGAVGGVDEPTQLSEEQLDEPVVKKKRLEGLDGPVTAADTDGEDLSLGSNSNTEDSQPGDWKILEDEGSAGGSDAAEAILEESRAAEGHSCSPAPSPSGRLSEDCQQVNLPAEEEEASPDNQEEGDEGVVEGASKFYCYLCSITCHNQQNFRSHMNSVSHQQRMMEIQHMSNACLVTLLPRVQESLQGASKDGEKKEDTKHWCATCHTHYTSSITEHRRTEEHKLASRTTISSCTVCKKHFRTSQIFVEHLQSQEHRQKVEKLQEKERCEALAKLTGLDSDGFLLEEVEGSEVEEGEERPRSEGEQEYDEKQDGWSSLKEVTLKDMASDEQYDPDTVYASSFFVPVAGFICRLCNKFYHFESAALHTHCKSLQHFESLKRYREMLSRKAEDAASPGESAAAADGLRPEAETTTDCSNLNSPQPVSALENQQPEDGAAAAAAAAAAEPGTTSQESSSTTVTSTDPHSVEGGSTSQAEPAQPLPPQVRDEQDLEASATAAATEEEVEGVEEEEAPPAPAAAGKAKAASKRRSGRARNRR